MAQEIVSPQTLWQEYPLSATAQNTVSTKRCALFDILNGNDDRLVVVIGPCSIHDPIAAIEYAKKLRHLIDQHQDHLCILMRAYFEKPRTITGWKGLIDDPDLNGSHNIQKGLKIARKLLIDINEIGVATGSEILNPLSAPYFSDLLSWSVVGARTVESQVHRELAASLPMPIGFKNSTGGNINVAMDGMQAASRPHQYLTINENGQLISAKTQGNPYTHLVLRGSHKGANIDIETTKNTAQLLKSRHLCERFMIDCSHGNSQKDPHRQLNVINTLCDRIASNTIAPFGVMIESNLVGGRQQLAQANTLTYGQSITDACISFEETIIAIEKLSHAVTKSAAKHPENVLN